eukprot:TRINITY_DN573_c1_g1_i3.p1 TRINITY_DN573_c1_g1~~TRINITY_DN573_c1_g1_i3.p1  ORF type:complete len:677 (+),score=194.84 TRINITY_DN573_c1_g1_i3:126-2156(+)
MPLIRAGVLANTKRYRGIRRQQTALRSARSARGQPNRSPELRPTNKKGRRLSVREVKELEENRKQLAGLRGYFGSEWSLWLAIQCRKISKSKQFQTFIISAIFAAGFLVGWQTYEEDTESTTSEYISYGDSIILVIFIFEILVKMLAEGNKPHKYFKDGWNCFDFVIVAVGALPFGGNAVTALRLVRLLRVLKLVRALPKLRILVMGLINSLSSIAYISLLLLLLFYLYAVVGVSLFEKNDPVHFGTLHIATLTLFRCSTLEDWTDVMYIQMYGCDDYGYDGMMEECTDPRTLYSVSILYFVTFVVLSAMMILNLFIGVITSSMQDAKLDIDEEDEDIEEPQNEADEKLDERLTNLSSLLADLNNEIDEFATLERERSGHTKVLISGKNPEKNMMTDQHGNDIAHTLMSDDKIRKNSLTSQTSLGSPLHSHSRMRTGSGSGSFDRPSFRRSSSGNIPSMFSSIPLGGGGGIHSVAFSSSPKRDMSERRGSNLPVVEEAETGGSPDSDRALLNNNNINNNNNNTNNTPNEALTSSTSIRNITKNNKKYTSDNMVGSPSNNGGVDNESNATGQGQSLSSILTPTSMKNSLTGDGSGSCASYNHPPAQIDLTSTHDGDDLDDSNTMLLPPTSSHDDSNDPPTNIRTIRLAETPKKTTPRDDDDEREVTETRPFISKPDE